MTSDFIFNGTAKKLKVSSVKPGILSKLFKIDESSIIITDADGECYIVDGNRFEPNLVTGKVYTVDGTAVPSIATAAPTENSVASQRNRAIVGIQGANRNKLIEDVITSCKNLNESANMLYSAPQAAGLVEGLAILSKCCAHDASLVTKDMPAEKFIRLRTPHSFQASLYQVAASMCNAFRTADYSMNTIRAALVDLPMYFSDTLEIVEESDNEKSKKILSRTIRTIDSASIKCKEMAEKAKNAFDDVLGEINELCQTSVASKSTNAKELEEMKKRKADFEVQRIAHHEASKKLEEQHQQAKVQAKEALKEYRAQINNSSGLGKLFLATLADGVFETVRTCTNLPANLLTGAAKTVGKLIQHIPFGQESVECSETMSYAVEHSLLRALEKIADDFENPRELDNELICDYITSLKDFQKYSWVTMEGKELFRIAKVARKFLEDNQNPDKRNEINEIKIAIKNCVDVYAKAREEQRKERELKIAATMSFREKVVQADMAKTTSTHEHYTAESVREETLRKELNENRKKLTEIVCNLQNIDTTSVELTDIIEYLRDGIFYLGKVKQNWQNLANFFDSIKIIVDNNLSSSIQSFIENAKDDTSRKLMLQCALKATGYCIQVSNCAEIYTSVSQKYVMPVISGIGEQLAMSQTEARRKQTKIKLKLDQVNFGIKDLIEQKQAENEDRVREQMKTYAENMILVHSHNKAIGY